MEEEATDSQSAPKRFSWWRVLAALLVICGIPYWILYPVFRSAKIAALRAREEEYVRAADLALIMQMDQHDDRYPDLSGDMTTTLRPFIKDPKVIEAMKDYVWNTNLSGKREWDVDDSATMWVVYVPEFHGNRYVTGFADGHVKRIPSAWFNEIRKLGTRIKKETPAPRKAAPAPKT